MSTFTLRVRYMSLALLVMVVVHGHLQTAHSGAAAGSSGLTRLSRDLMRLAGSDTRAKVDASEWKSTRNPRDRA
ncbi:MAG TPA: hypothetical protein VKG63_04835 [Steroidobacteraceae bacterium]|nr:hypothetical protein [Steroidobacteraceae bacterium]